MTQSPFRSTEHQIINRLGIDNLVGQIARLRESDQFKAVGPDSVVQLYPLSAKAGPTTPKPTEQEAEIWFDWAFVDFWKSNYCEMADPIPKLCPLKLHCLRCGATGPRR